ncbi:MAG: GNAT family N-acetyltransferase [Methanosphaera sp.]|nr:GNAT family N-acetyltransferase [Methanosphaera sp.]
MTNFRKLNENDDIETIAAWIYSTDTFLFNPLFFNDKIRAITGIERLITSNYSNPYHRDYIIVIYDENPDIIEGVAVSFRGSDISVEQTIKAMRDTSCTSLPLILQYSVNSRLFASHIRDNDYYLGNLYVNPEYRKNGNGSKLVEKCKQLARQSNCKQILLDVEYTKPYLLDFYAKLGFKKSSKNYHRIFGKTYGCYGLKCKLD